MKKILITLMAFVTLMIGNVAYANSLDTIDYIKDENGTIVAIVINEGVTDLTNYPLWEATTAETIYFNATNCERAYYEQYDDPTKPFFAFDGYNNIKNVVFGDGVTNIPKNIFYGKSTIDKIVLSGSIETIEAGAFQGTGIKNITIPGNVKTIGHMAFGNCANLNEVTITSNELSVSQPFRGSGVIKATFLDEVSCIPEEILSYCSKLKTVTMSSNIESIANRAFSECISLSQIDIPEKVYRIGNEAFLNCPLTEIQLPNSLLTIGERAFCGSAATNITVPESVESIGELAFSSDSLAELTVPFVGAARNVSEDKMKKLAYVAGYTSTTVVENIGSVTDYILKPNVKKVTITGDYIPDYAFYESKYLETVEAINAKTIGKNAFWGCSSLCNAVFSDKTTQIGNNAFFNCANLPAIIMGDTAQIEAWAFYGCSKLKNISGKAVDVGELSFYNCNTLEDISFLESVEYVGIDALYNTAWYNTQQDGVLYVGNSVYAYKGNMPEDTIIDIKGGAVSITEKAFYNQKNLVEIRFPNSLKSIGARAFDGCGLKSIVLTENLEIIGAAAFLNCPITNELIIPENVNEIGYSAFGGQIYNFYYNAENCASGSKASVYADSLFYDNIVNLIIGKEVKSIPENAFKGCTSVVNIYYCGNESEWNTITINDGNECFDNIDIQYDFEQSQLPVYYGFCGDDVYWNLCKNTLTVGGQGATYNYDYYKEIYSPWYEHRQDITSINFEGNINCLGNSLFYGLLCLKKVDVPETVTTLKSNVFYKCEALNDVILPETLISIGSGVLSQTLFEENEENWYENGFYYNTYLLKAKMNITDDFIFKPNTTLIAANTFMGRSYKNIVVPKTVKYVGGNAFWECLAETVIFKGSVSYANPLGMFYNCDFLKNIVLPRGITEIAGNTFESCDMLEFVEIPEGVTTIWSYGFEDCKSLKSVIIPTTITTLNNGTFYGCDLLSDIYFKNSSINTPYMNESNTYLFNATMHFNTPYIDYKIDSVETKHNIDISVYNLSEGKIIVAGYKNKKLVDIMYRDMTDIDNTVELNGKIDEFKILIWDNLLNLKPLCRATVVYN